MPARTCPSPFNASSGHDLPGGETPAAFVERVSQLLSPGEGSPVSQAAPTGFTAGRPSALSVSRRPISIALSIAVVLLLIGGYVAWDKLVLSKPEVPPAVPTAPAKAPAPSTVPEKSIAVLPFVDMSEKKDQEYFSDGLSEELIDLLAKTQGLEVIARTSSFYFKGKQATIGEIAKTLNVAHVMEGSVRKSGNTIRVTAQLIRASDGVHIWSETYDRDLKDVFKVQDEIALGVVAEVEAHASARHHRRSARTVNAEAHRLYLQGRYFKDRDTSEDLVEGGGLFQACARARCKLRAGVGGYRHRRHPASRQRLHYPGERVGRLAGGGVQSHRTRFKKRRGLRSAWPCIHDGA